MVFYVSLHSIVRNVMGMYIFVQWDVDPEIVNLFGMISIRYYSLLFVSGLMFCYRIVQGMYKREKLSSEHLWHLAMYIFVGTVVGARLGHCLFYEPGYYLSHPLEMLLPVQWINGSLRFTGYHGLASHGGAIGVWMAIMAYARKYKEKIWAVLDKIAVVAPLAGAFIRLGNLMNSEIIGYPTTVPWAFVFQRVDVIPRHPAQLYEAIAYLCFFLIILFIYKKKGPKSVGTGLYFGLCLTLIFTFRFLVEYTKEIQVDFEATLPMDMGQILSLPLIAVGVACLVGGKWMEKLGARSRK